MEIDPENIKPPDEKNPLDLFTQGIKSDRTRYVYMRKLYQIFFEYFNAVLSGAFEERAVQLLDLGREKPAWTCGLMMELVRLLRARTMLGKDDPDYLSPKSINTTLAPLQKLFTTNDVTLPWKRIRDTFPEMEMYDTRDWTREEIRKMLRHARGAIDRAILLVMASSGVRIGGMELKWRDIVPIYDDGGGRLREGKCMLDEDASKPVACAMMSVYAATRAEYAAFITPEAYGAVQEYRAVWAREAGREPTPDDPFIKKAGPSTAGLTHDGIKQRAYKAIWNAGLRGSEMKEGKRYNVPGMNGLRRFCNKGLKDARFADSPLSSMIKKERMLGHVGLIKLDKNYFKTISLEIAKEYLNAVPNLTIYETGHGGSADAGAAGDDAKPGPTADGHGADAPDAKPPTGKDDARRAVFTPESICPNCDRAFGTHTKEEYEACLAQVATKILPGQPDAQASGKK